MGAAAQNRGSKQSVKAHHGAYNVLVTTVGIINGEVTYVAEPLPEGGG